MVLTDAQQCLVLQERKGLITHCMNGWSRNLNYLGEIMLYSSFGVMCQRVEVWYIYGVVWGFIFTVRMLGKERSLSRKQNWPEYKAKTWFIVPKLYNSTLVSLILYSIFASVLYYSWTQGGFEKAAKSLMVKK